MSHHVIHLYDWLRIVMMVLGTINILLAGWISYLGFRHSDPDQRLAVMSAAAYSLGTVILGYDGLRYDFLPTARVPVFLAANVWTMIVLLIWTRRGWINHKRRQSEQRAAA